MAAPLPAELDLRGLKCPLPALRTRKTLGAMQAGERLAVLCTDPLAVIDIPNLVQEDGHRLDCQTRSNGVATFVIVKWGSRLAGTAEPSEELQRRRGRRGVERLSTTSGPRPQHRHVHGVDVTA